MPERHPIKYSLDPWDNLNCVATIYIENPDPMFSEIASWPFMISISSSEITFAPTGFSIGTLSTFKEHSNNFEKAFTSFSHEVAHWIGARSKTNEITNSSKIYNFLLATIEPSFETKLTLN